MQLLAIFLLLTLFHPGNAFIGGAVNAVAGAGKAAVDGTVSLGKSVYNGVRGVFTTSGDTDDYHSTDEDLIASKQRLLGGPTSKYRPSGGVRARLKNETVEMPAAANDLFKLSKDVQALSAGSTKFTSVFNGVTDMYPKIIRMLKDYRRDLERNKTVTDNHIRNFAEENTAEWFKSFKEGPGIQSKVFEKFNQGVTQMYHSLERQLKGMNRTFNDQGRTTMTSLKDIMSSQNKTMKNLVSTMKSQDFTFRQKLNRKAIPDLVIAEYLAATDLARVRKAGLDSINDFDTNTLPSIRSQADSYIDTQGTKVVDSAKKLMDKSASNLRRQLLVMQNSIDRQVRLISQQIDKNITSLGKNLDAGTRSVAANRKAALSQLSKTVDAAIEVVDNFKRDVVGTAGDLSNMLTVGGVNMDAIDNQNKLTRESIESEADSRQRSLSSSDVLTKSRDTIASGMNSVQGGISSTYTQGKGASSNMKNFVESRVNAGLSDSSDIAAQISNQVSGVQSSQEQVVGPLLGRGIGLTSSHVSDVRRGRVTAIGDLAANIQAEIDSTEADLDEAVSDSVSGAEKSTINSQSSVMNALANLNSRIAERQSDLQQRHADNRGKWIKALTASRSNLAQNYGSISGVQKLIASLQSGGSLQALDSENEERITSALSELTELRRLGSSSGDSMQTMSAEFLAKILGSVPASFSSSSSSSSTSFSETNTSALDDQIDYLKTVSGRYKSQITEFESGMNKQLQDINAQYTAIDRSVSTGPVAKAIGSIVSHEQSILAQAGRDAVRAIYNSSSPQSVQGTIAQYVARNPRFDIDRYLGYLLHDDTATGFPATYGLLTSKLSELLTTASTAESGLSSFFNYLEKLKGSIATKLSEVPPSELKQLQDLADYRQSVLDEVEANKAGLNGTIMDKFRVINETIENKTTNFYKQFQMASIFADSLVQGFADYVNKMIAYEKLTEKQRGDSQAQLIATIQRNANATEIQNALRGMNSSEIDRINKLVAEASDTTDQSASGIERRRAANQALIDAMGTKIASDMMERYRGLQANSEALAKSLQSASDEYASNREASIAAAQLGVDGINSQSLLFSNIADENISDQKARASELGKAIDSLLSNSTFLQNISTAEFGKILKSVQESDQLSFSRLGSYRSSNKEQVATLNGVVGDFSFLVEQEVNRTREFLDALSANFTNVSRHTNFLSDSVMGDLKQNLSAVFDKIDSTNTTLNSDRLSIDPIQEGVEGRLAQLVDNQNVFADKAQSELRQLVARVDALDSAVAMARDKDIRRLRSSLTQMTEDFRSRAIQMQSAVGGFIETESSRDIKEDLGRRVSILQRYAGV